MSPTGNSDIQQALAEAMASRPYTHRQDVDAGIAAVITVEEDARFLAATLRALLTQNVLPGVIIIADATGATGQPVRTSFEVIPSPAGPVMAMPQAKEVSVQIVRAKGARSFGDAVDKSLDYAELDPSTRALWLLHDDSRPADDTCLERLLESWRNTPGANVLGCKQCDWDGKQLHNVGMYAGRHTVHSLVVDGEPDQEQYDGRQDVYAVSLAGALVSLSTFKRLKGINPWFTTYGESLDFCRRVCQSGGRVVIVPQAQIAHRRARYEGVRTRGGEALNSHHTISPAMTVARAQQRYLYTDMAMSSWIPVWLWRFIRSFGMALAMLFGKKPYGAWIELCLPWLALTSIPGAMRSRRLVARQSKVPMSSLQVLAADRRQIAQFHDRRDAFIAQQGVVLLSPLERAHLRSRIIRRWSWAMIMALVSFLGIMAIHWPVFRAVFSNGSLYSNTLLPTGASFHQLAQAATTPWVFGSGIGIPASPTPWLLVLMVASLFTIGHVGAALSLMLFAAAPLAALSFWALAGIFTRSDVVRVLGGLLWASSGIMFGWYAGADLPMLTVLVFLPAAFAFVFRAVGMYHTEDPLKPRPSVQAAALSALCFIPVVAAEPQLLLALVVTFVAFLMFVRRKRATLLLIPVPAAFAVAPILVNSVRYAHLGSWRQLFGDIMVPSTASNGSPEALSLLQVAQRALGWNPLSTHMLDLAMALLLLIVTVLAIASLVLPFALRASRLMWVVIVCGAALSLVSSRVAIDVDAGGPVAGSAEPGMLLMMMGFLACVCLVAGGAVKRFHPLHSNAQGEIEAPARDRLRPLIVSGRMVLAVVLAGCVAIQCWYGLERHHGEGLGVSRSGLPMVTTDYLASGEDHRVLAISAQTRNVVDYSVMRTSRGDLIDSSPAQRVRLLDGEHDEIDQTLAKACATLLSNPDEDAIATISQLGFGGIYVVSDGESATTATPYEQLSANIAASNGTQALVSTDAGTYYRLTLRSAASQNVDTSWQQRTQNSSWRRAWLICLAVVLALYCLVALPRRRIMDGLEEEA
ncbi:glycosyltransferase family 2 protein [Bifidobacterium miconisargentati]|uniref:glycosyltransferase family 2 protein n=1 Tax=Bifidobacterium miconisargentati TaxID=2834437 RepID=UPI001BDBD823|nr:glycosyltransferase family 2 protein [Bifidobacterium miconisargentati]MBW3089276.1 glycosyltransferase family 2 protein [Bifidobacterium miconisargentati]